MELRRGWNICSQSNMHYCYLKQQKNDIIPSLESYWFKKRAMHPLQSEATEKRYYSITRIIVGLRSQPSMHPLQSEAREERYNSITRISVGLRSEPSMHNLQSEATEERYYSITGIIVGLRSEACILYNRKPQKNDSSSLKSPLIDSSDPSTESLSGVVGDPLMMLFIKLCTGHVHSFTKS